MSTQTQLKEILEELIRLLDSVEELNWQATLEHFRRRCNGLCVSEEGSSLSSEILRIYAGMGSFSDLVLYKNGKLLRKENEELTRMRTQLWSIARELR